MTEQVGNWEEWQVDGDDPSGTGCCARWPAQPAPDAGQGYGRLSNIFKRIKCQLQLFADLGSDHDFAIN